MGAEVFYESSSELARVSNTFSVAGVATDPTTVSLTIIDPLGVSTTYTYAASEITRSSTGAYRKDVPCTVSGTWQYAFVGTGAATDVQLGTWYVQKGDLQRLYCTPEEFKDRTRIDDDLDDAVILQVLRANSRAIDAYCNRRFDRITATRTYAASSPWMLDFDDSVSITTFKTDPNQDGTFAQTWTAGTDYELLGLGETYNIDDGPELKPYVSARAIGGLSFPIARTRIGRRALTQIVGVYGWSATPDAVKQACAIMSSDAFKLRDAPFGIAGFGEFGGMRIRDNQRATSLLAPYVKHRILVG